MRRGTKPVALGPGLLAAGAFWRVATAQDAGEDAFDSAEVKEIAGRVAALKVADEIAVVRRIRKSLDAKLLVVSEDAWKGHEILRGRPDAGMARILERGRFDDLVTPRGGGAYWSFTKRSNSYDKSPQIELQQGRFSSGFYGGTAGLVVRLGDGDLGAVDPASVPAELTQSAADVLVSRRRTMTREERIADDESRKAEVGRVYGVRAVMEDDCDVLAAFEVVSMDGYGATIAWRVLKVYDVPKRPAQPATPTDPARLGEGGKGGGNR